MEGDQQGYDGEHRGLVDDGEPGKRLVKSGFSFGRLINGCIAFDYLLVLLTALIVCGSLGVLNSTLAKDYPDRTENNRTCILFTNCITDVSGTCHIEYNSSGGCEFIVAGFGIVAFLAIVYIVVCILRIVFGTDIWWSVIADILANIFIILWIMVMGITISIGLAYTCGQVNTFYGTSGLYNCSERLIPDKVNGYRFYGKANVAQGATWFCFLFVFISMIIFVVRSCIFCRRKAKIPAMDNTDILTATDGFKETDDDDYSSKPV